MALLRPFNVKFFESGANLMRPCSTFLGDKCDFSKEMLEDIKKSRNEEDMPKIMTNPFTKEKPQCLLCKYNIDPSYKNIRLLSQFVSSFTGRVYGRHITGLCKYRQNQIEVEIKKAQSSGLMGVYIKDPNFLNDPDLYDTSKPFRVL